MKLQSAVAALVMLGSVACGSTEPDFRIQGIYELSTVNGAALPVAVSFEASAYTWKAATLEVNTDSSYIITVEVAAPGLTTACGANCASESISGVWSQSVDGTLRFKNDGDTQGSAATFANDQLTVAYEGARLVFLKRELPQ